MWSLETSGLVGSTILKSGNPEAESPNYDFASNHPEVLPTTPIRGVLEPAKTNPNCVAPPKPPMSRQMAGEVEFAGIPLKAASCEQVAVRQIDSYLT